MRREDMRVYVITDDAGRAPDELARIVRAALAGGATAVQLREKSAPAATCREACALLHDICRAAGAPLFVNADLLDILGGLSCYDGIHAGQASVERVCALLEPDGLASRVVGYSAHSAEECARMLAAGAAFATLSPIHATASKPGAAPAGLRLIEDARRLVPAACLVALGGITAANAGDAIRAGADGVAVIGAVMRAPDPHAASRLLRDAVERALHG